MAHNDHKVGVTFIWTIENFDEIFEADLESPMFVSSSLNDTEWKLCLCPIGNDVDYISLILKRYGTDDKGIHRIIVDCELSILDKDGLILKYTETENHGFVLGHNWKCEKFVLKNDVFDGKKSEYLPFGSLIVRCRMWRRFNEITQAEFRCLNTKIEKTSFVWAINDFSGLKSYQRRQIHVKKTDSETPILTFEFFLFAGNGQIEITPGESPCFELSCCISILDCSGKILKSEDKSFKLMMDTWNPYEQKFIPEIWKFPSFIKKSELCNNKNLYLTMDVMSLLVEVFFWTGYTNDEDGQPIPIQNLQVSEKLSSSHQSDKQCMAENLANITTFDKECMTENLPNTFKCDKQCMTETEVSEFLLPTRENETSNGVRDCSSYEKFVHDMQCMYEEGFLSDFSLRSGNKTFQVHKNILSARSPVFRAMFTTPMKEKEADGIDVPDIDEDTLQRMLVFVYSNRLGDLNWESAIDLYFAADKYAIEDLRSVTRSILKSKLSVLNVCEVLVHADLHEDQDLRSTAMDYIVSHDKEIVGTEDWKKFQKKHIHLTVEILSILYSKLKT